MKRYHNNKPVEETLSFCQISIRNGFHFLIEPQSISTPNFERSYKTDCRKEFDTLVPEAFFYSLLANFVTRTASYIFFLLANFQMKKDHIKRKPLGPG